MVTSLKTKGSTHIRKLNENRTRWDQCLTANSNRHMLGRWVFMYMIFEPLQGRTFWGTHQVAVSQLQV